MLAVAHFAFSPRGRRGIRRLAVAVCLLVLWPFLGTGNHALRAANPNSPEVRALIDSGFAYLATADDSRIGAKALMGLAFYKYGKPDHPKCKGAVSAIQHVWQAAELDSVEGLSEGTIYIYTSTLCLIFLCNLDGEEYRSEIEQILESLVSLQKPCGGWGYPNNDIGDTSMTQYAVLSLWEANRVGVTVDLEVWERVCEWYLRTQDPRGGFGYQANDPGNYTLVSQGKSLLNSMSAAGAVSLYVCGDYFSDVTGIPVFRRQASSEGPLRRAKPAAGGPAPGAVPNGPRRNVSVDMGRIRQTAGRADAWLNSNYLIHQGHFPFYYLYTLERYHSFRTGGDDGSGPLQWYDDGVELLQSLQREDGRWDEGSQSRAAASTAFALLFLLRSTKQSLDPSSRYGAGTLVGGRGIPLDADGTALRNGQIMPRPLAGPAEDILRRIGNPNDPEYDKAIARLNEMADAEDPEELDRHAARLRELAGTADAEARVSAVQLLAKNGDGDNLATLIYALTDPDERVVLAARDGLRRWSRRISGYGIEPGQTAATRTAAIERWENWYLSIRPDAEFVD